MNMIENNKETTSQQKKLGAKSLLKKIFAESGAAINDLEDGRLGFTYGYGDNQSEYFVVDADDEHVNIRLFDYSWHEVSIWDIDRVTKIQSAVNALNTVARCKVVCHFDDDDKMLLSTLLTCPLYEGIPDIRNYFTSQLENMVQSHDFIFKYCGSDKGASEEASTETQEVPTNKEKGGEE